jgi:hypothetical protein
MLQSGIANGDIYPMRFVKLDSTTDGRLLQCGAGDRPIGISQKSTRRSEYIDTSGKAALAGEPVQYYDVNEICALQLGGTVARGDRLKSDANGKGITAATDGDAFGAIAEAAGVLDQFIPVQVSLGEKAS